MTGSRRGFTLIELACVVAIISALISLAVPNYLVYRHQAYEAEARINLETIAYLEHAAILDDGRPIACPKNPASIPRPTLLFESAEAWRNLGFKPLGRVRFQYQVEVDGDRFIVSARGNLDGDDAASSHAIDSRTMQLASNRASD